MNTDKSKTSDVTITKSSNRFPVVGIGASAGGLDAFKKLLKAIPENSGMAYVLVQHLDPKHDSLLPELLQKVTKIPVLEISDDIKVQPDHIYIIPSNKMMVANDGVLLLSPRSANKNERNLPIDIFFTSLAEVHQSHSIGVVLSGTASDGTKGLKAIKDHGGITFAQSKESAAYDGMPHSAIQAGVVDFILAPEAIPQKLQEITRIMVGNRDQEEKMPLQDADVFKQILALLRIRKGTDFTYYKQTTIRRRILRRMALNKNEESEAYLTYLRENKLEQDILYQDLLIPVTSFFRDAKTFDNLCETVLPQILKDRKEGEPIRIWVTACSTGQEVYSLAMCLKEFLGDYSSTSSEERVQIFATDISEPAILKARHGIYAKSEIEGVSPQRLHDFFSKSNGGYQVNKSIRDMCVFAMHNFLKDPPFGKMDLISCRNVLIYMEPYLQKKALTTFHYALNEKGFLLLGKSETISAVPELFAIAVKGDKLFSRKNVPGKFMHLASQRSEQGFADWNAGPKTSHDKLGRTDFQKTADDIMLSKYTPAGVVVNEEMDIVHFRGKTANYLEQEPGKPSHNLLKMARKGLAFELRNILHKAKKNKSKVIKENIPIDIDGSLRYINIEALPLPDTIEPHYLVLFHEILIGNNQRTDASKKTSSKIKSDDRDLRIELLEKELSQLREDMRSITEDQEAANEELQSANEELLSGSEELQSLNEEMETGKEELQSTNEELSVVNHEMIGLNEQVTEARNYAENIIATIREPLLVLDKNLRIRSANRAFYRTFQVNESETENKLISELGNKQWNNTALWNLLENILPEKSKIEDFEVTHNFPNIGERVMLLNAREMKSEKGGEKLMLLAIEDVTEKMSSSRKIEESERRLRNLVDQAPTPILILKGENMVIEVANDPAFKILSAGKEVLGKPFLEIIPEMKEQPFMGYLLDVFHKGVSHYGKEEPAYFIRENGKKDTAYFNFVFQPYHEEDGSISGVLVLSNDVTEQVLSRKKIEESEAKYRSLFETMDQGFCIVEVLYDKHNNPIDYLFVEVNPVFGEQSGLMNAVGKTVLELVPDFERHWIEIFGKVVSTGESIRFIEGSDAIGRMFDVYAFKIGDADENRVAILFTDITERKRAEKNLKESEQYFRQLTDTVPAIIWITEPDGYCTYLNKNWYDYTGQTEEEAKGFGWLDATHPDDKDEAGGLLIEANAQQKPFSASYRLKTKSGEFHWAIRNGSPKFSVDGVYEGMVGTVVDVHEEKLAEENVRRFKYMAENASDPFILMCEDGTFAYLNKLALESWGYTEEEAKHIRVPDVYPVYTEEVFKEAFGKAQKESIPPFETLHKTKEGTVYPVEINMDGLLLDGKPHLFAVARDITERKKAQQALQDSEAFSRSVLENSPDCVKIIDTDGRVQFMNTNGMLIMEIDDFESIKNKPWAQLWGEANKQKVVEAVDEAKGGKIAQFQAYCPTAKGTLKWWDVMVSPVHEAGSELITSLISVSRDVTDQLAVKGLLDYRKALLEANNEASIDGILLVDTLGEILSYNKRFLEIWNMPQSILDAKNDETALSFAATQLVNPDQFIEKVNELYEHPKEISTDILELTSGKIIERHGYPVVAPDGTYYAWSWTFRDITVAKRTELGLKQSEQNFRQLAELLPDKISHADETGTITYYNQSWLSYTGYSSEELYAWGWNKIIHPDDEEEFNKLWLYSIQTGEDFEMEIRLLNKTGEYLWHLSRSVAVKDDGGKIKRWMATNTEIQKIREEGQRKSDFLKMVSHELKTPVTSIKGYVQFLAKMLTGEQEKLLEPLPLRSSLMRIDSQIGRLTRLITEMLDLTRIEESRLELQLEPFVLNDLVNEVVEDLRFSAHKHKIIISSERSFNVLGDRDRIGQVTINFITNAIKYSPNSDAIEVRLHAGGVNQVAVSVKDDGIGIEQKDQERIFERFYRVEGKNEQQYGGFGIGLFVAAEIIKRHNGYITVESKKGEGSVFTFGLPCK